MRWTLFAKSLVILVAGFSANAAANASQRSDAQDARFFDAFKAFCVDTDLDPRGVETAVKNAGGVPHSPPGSATERPFPMAFKTWDVTVNGHRLLVSASVMYPPKFSWGQYACRVQSYQSDDRSLAAVQNWILAPSEWKATDFGLLPEQDQQKGPLRQYSYVFQLVGQAHKPIRTRDEYLKASLEGRVWGADILRDANSLDVRVFRDGPKRPNPN